MLEYQNWIEGLSDIQRQQFEVYYRQLVKWNAEVNLTSIVDEQEVYIKHFYDSCAITALPMWNDVNRQNGTVADIGTGAGFPGLPLAILYPNVKFLLCDSLQKRIKFLDHIKTELNLSNVTTIHGRAEDIGQQSLRGTCDMVVSRAVARMNVLLELTFALVKVGGWFVAYKGPNVEAELDDGIRAAEKLGGQMGSLVETSLPYHMGKRVFVPVQKIRVMSKQYPRQAGTPAKSPL